MVQAAAAYPEIAQYTTQSKDTIDVNGRHVEYRNTNHLVDAPGWDILLSKTGFTNEAGYCLAMRMQSADRRVILVLLGARTGSQRAVDALNVQRWLAGETTYLAAATLTAHRTHLTKAKRAYKRHKQVRLSAAPGSGARAAKSD